MTALPSKQDFKNAQILDVSQNDLLRFITCGSVDDGKSTLIGRLLHDAGQVYQDQIDAARAASSKFGTTEDEIDYALLVDGLSAEREQGITIDVAYRYFRTPKRAFIVADTPGHEQYTRNMATGASNADVAIILIDARLGVLTQTRRHALIVSLMGVKKIAIAINKMDLVNYDRKVFDRIKSDFSAFADRLGFDEIKYFPICALKGENVARAGTKQMPWYLGYYLLEYLEEVKVKANKKQAFRFPVQWVNRPNLDFRGFSGYVSSGFVKIGDTIRVSSSGETAKVAKIVTYDGETDIANQGQVPTICLDKEIDVSRGDIFTNALDPIRPKSGFIAKLFWMNEAPSSSNKEYRIRISNSEALARIEVENITDLASFNETPAQILINNSIGTAKVEISKPLLIDEYKKDKELGAFILIDKITNETLALGMIQSIETNAPKTGFMKGLAHKILPNHANPVASAQYLFSWRLFSIAVFPALALAVFKSWWAFAAVFIFELMIRPLLQWAHYTLYYMDTNLIDKKSDNYDGGGI